MTRKRIVVVSFSLLAVVIMVFGVAVAASSVVPQSAVEAQEIGQQEPESTTVVTDGETGTDAEGGEIGTLQVGGPRDGFEPPNDERLILAIDLLNTSNSSDALQEAIYTIMDEGMGSRVLPSKDAFAETTAAHDNFNTREQMAIDALEAFVKSGDRVGENEGQALNALNMYSEMNQIAGQLALITPQCGFGDFVLMGDTDNSLNPCAQLQPLMDSSTGLENEAVFSPDDTVFGQVDSTFKPIDPLTRSYSVNLRADLIPPRWSRDIPEHVEITEPLAPGQCSVVFKEFRGLLMQLHIEGITTVKDPGNKSGVSGTTTEPIWVLRWMPAQYGKQWSMCNTGNTSNPEVTTTVTRQVVEDEGLIYFWRFYE